MSVASFETPKRELLVFYYKYRRRLILSFALPFAAAIAASFVPTPHYEASSTLVVRLGAEYVYQPESSTGLNSQASPIPFDRDQIYKAEVAILGSTDLHEEVIQTVGLDRMYPSKGPNILQEVLNPVRLSILSALDALYPDDADPSLLGGLASSLRAALLDDDADIMATPEEKARKRLEKAEIVFDKNLRIDLEKESAVIDLTFMHKNRDVAIEALDTLLKLYMEKRKQLYLETRSGQARDQADKIHRRVAALQEQLETYKREHKLYSLNDQRTQLLAQREDIRKQMASVSSVALEDKMNDVTQQLDALDAQEREFNALQQDLQVASDEYTIYSHKFDEAQTYDSVERARAGSVRVIQPPAAPPEPKRLQGIILLAGFMLSLIVTVLAAAFTEFSRSGFLTPERLERNIGLPILCAIPLRKE